MRKEFRPCLPDAGASLLSVHVHRPLTESDVRAILVQIDQTLFAVDQFRILKLEQFAMAVNCSTPAIINCEE